ncbi:MAG TPA: hypothetical protein DCZ10_11870 [Pelotomaculum sp.]|nr:hypothetical protein [Pelotomaculum sp.]
MRVYVEALANIDTVVLDKTGVITAGRPVVTAVETAEGVAEKEILLHRWIIYHKSQYACGRLFGICLFI